MNQCPITPPLMIKIPKKEPSQIERTAAVLFGEAIQTVFRALNLFNVTRIGENAYLGSRLSGLCGIAILLPTLGVAVRRLRDADHGWANLLWSLVPVAGIVVLIVLWAQPTKTPTTAATA